MPTNIKKLFFFYVSVDFSPQNHSAIKVIYHKREIIGHKIGQIAKLI